MPKRLWEIEHAYYCEESNYFDTGTIERYETWSDFMDHNADADFNMNLLFRWDWDEIDGETMQSTFTGDDHHRNATLKLFWMGQRKGIYRCTLTRVCRADEPDVVKFLKPRWEHLHQLWAPLSTPKRHKRTL